MSEPRAPVGTAEAHEADEAARGRVGRVHAVQAFPVKSLQAAPAASIRLEEGGVVGDRRYAVVGDAGVLTADEAPGLRDVLAVLGPDGAPTLTLPGGSGGSGGSGGVRGAAADQALTSLVGRPVRVASVPAGSVVDAPVHLVSRQALDAAARGEHAAANCACSLTEPRANLVLDTPGSREEQWIGGRLAVGGAVLRVIRRPGHCLGVYAEVERSATVRPGDPVQLVDEP
jgi:MOSC domain-containing protein